MADAKQIAIEVLRATNPTFRLAEMLTEVIMKRASAKSPASENLKTLQDEMQRQELEMRIAEAQARVAQEIAIASRIETAEEVDIEEYYDLSGEGHVGVRGGDQGLSLGAGASGRRVRKRVYKFRGQGPSPAAVAEQDQIQDAPAQKPSEA